MDVFMFVEEADLFKGMSDRFMTELRKIVVEEPCNPGTFLFRTGDPAECLYILREGRVRLAVGERGHMTHTVGSAGEAFGWSSLVDRDSYSASAECLTPCRVVKIDKRSLYRILENDPASGMLFYKRLAGVIGQRLVESYDAVISAHGLHGPPPYGG